MKKLVFVLAMVIAIISLGFIFPLGKCEKEEGEIQRKEVKIASFNKIKLTGSSTVYLSQGESQKVEIETTENIMELLEKDVDNQEWTIRFKKCIKTKKGVKFYITSPSFEALSINGSGDILGQNELKSENLKLSVKGSGDLTLELDAEDLEVKIMGSGDIKLEGKCKSQDISIIGSGDYSAKNLKSQNANVSVNGSGDASLFVKKNLDAKVTGSGDISYWGNPETKQTQVTGSGDITAR